MRVPTLGSAEGLALDDPVQIERDLATLRHQQHTLQLPRFDSEIALALGLLVRELAVSRGQSVAVDIRGRGGQLFFTRMEGTSPNNADWLRRKRNVVALFEVSSYEVARDLALRQTDLKRRQGLPARDYAAVGGCVPIHVKGAGVVGDIGVSGLFDRDDHNLAVEALATFLD